MVINPSGPVSELSAWWCMWMYRAGTDWRDWGNPAENWASRLFPPVSNFMELVNPPRAHLLQDTGVLMSRGSGWFHTPCGYPSSLFHIHHHTQLGQVQSEEQSFALHLFGAAQQALASLPVFPGLVSSRCCCLAGRAGLGSSMVSVTRRVWWFTLCRAVGQGDGTKLVVDFWVLDLLASLPLALPSPHSQFSVGHKGYTCTIPTSHLYNSFSSPGCLSSQKILQMYKHKLYVRQLTPTLLCLHSPLTI